MYSRLSHTSEYKEGFDTWIVWFEKIVVLIQQFIHWKDNILKALNEHRQIFGMFLILRTTIFFKINFAVMVPTVQCYYSSDLMWRMDDKELRYYIKNFVKLLEVGKQ
jgi:hypothetical protein